MKFLKHGMMFSYEHHWIVDNMPLAWCYDLTDTHKNKNGTTGHTKVQIDFIIFGSEQDNSLYNFSTALLDFQWAALLPNKEFKKMLVSCHQYTKIQTLSTYSITLKLLFITIMAMQWVNTAATD